MAGKTVLILGGGVGGLVAAHELRRRLGREHRVLVIDKEREHRLQSSYLWLMMGRRNPAAISRDLALLERRGIEYCKAEVTRIDASRAVVETSAGAFAYDYLVVALGADLAEDMVPGLAQAGYTPYEFSDALRLGQAWRTLGEGSLAIVVASTPFKCPAAPYEAAFLLDDALRQRGVRQNIAMNIYTPEILPMPVAGPQVGQALAKMLADRDVQLNTCQKLVAVDAEKRKLTFDNEREARFDLLVYVPPHRSPAVVSDSGLGGETGWIAVDRHTLAAGHDHVYAIGDVAAVSLASGMMLPKAGVFAHCQAEVVAHNIAAEINRDSRRVLFDGWGACFVEVGNTRAALASGDFFAEPAPAVRLYEPARQWHTLKVVLEKLWMAAINPSPLIAQSAFWAMDFGMRALRKPTWLGRAE